MNSNSEFQAIVPYNKSKRELTRLNLDGIGQNCDRAFSYISAILEGKAGRLAHKLGFGPQAAINRIQNNLNSKIRNKILEEWYKLSHGASMFPGLEKDCVTLLEYAHP
jgi:hypothetical protein